MRKSCLSATVLAAAAFGSIPAGAKVLFDNLGTPSVNADCSFSTTCANVAGRGSVYAAQLFTVARWPSVVTAGAFSEIQVGDSPTSARYAILADVGGLPGGPAIVSGASALTASPFGVLPGYQSTLQTFSITPTTLAPGNYFIAIQSVSSNYNTFLEQGAATTGAAESHDGGSTWITNYEMGQDGSILGGISVALYGAAPEPATWSMLLVGIGGLGVAARVRRKRPTAEI